MLDNIQVSNIALDLATDVLVNFMPPRTLILADDLTGALDAVVGFAGAGCRVLVARSPAALPRCLAANPDILAINSASRETGPDEAARRVEEALKPLDPDSFTVVMKKIDSRLKGNIAAETGVLARWWHPARHIACPAIPTMGRRVVAGSLVGEGVPVPVDVAGCFGAPVEVPDIATDADLDRLVAGANDATLWIGARGLAFALARRAGIAAPDTAGLRPPLMIANGSRDPVTLAQIAALPASAHRIDAPDGVAPDTPLPHGPLVLSISDGGGGLTGGAAAAGFAESITRLARRYRPAALLICGGESAQAALDRLEADSLQVHAELRPGLPLCNVQMPWGPVQIVTKSGGFGAPGLLAEILEQTQADL